MTSSYVERDDDEEEEAVEKGEEKESEKENEKERYSFHRVPWKKYEVASTRLSPTLTTCRLDPQAFPHTLLQNHHLPPPPSPSSCLYEYTTPPTPDTLAIARTGSESSLDWGRERRWVLVFEDIV